MSDERIQGPPAEATPPTGAGEGAVPPGTTRGRFLLEVILVRVRFLGLFVVVGVIAGQWDRIHAYWERWTRPEAERAATTSSTEYFCPMHPQIVRDEPGSCPICGMPLSRRTKGAKEALPEGVLGRVQLSPYRIAQAGIRTAEVEALPLVREVSTVGFVEVDERNQKRITARIPGRVDRVAVDFTGLEVAEGQELVAIYSPELVAAQEAMLTSARALEAVRRSGADEEDLARARRVLDASRERLLLWGLTTEQVDAVLAGGKTRTHMEVLSPLAGTVLDRRVIVGQYVMEGEDLYRIADLRRIWVRARVFAEDLGVVRVGTEVEAEAEGFPGEAFRGTVAFVDPVVDPATRTVGVRMDLENPAGRLRPGLYVTARIRVPISDLEPFRSIAASRPAGPGHEGLEAGSRDPGRPGSYFTCTMHPNVVATEPGKCPECGMDLVAKDLGIGQSLQWWCPMHPEVTSDHEGEECSKCGGMELVPRVRTAVSAGRVLAVPELAVIDTGTRKVVYRETRPGVFDAVAVVLGPRSGEYYPVASGLSAGDRVAAAGAFLIDAETRLNPAASAAYFGASGTPSGGGGGHRQGK